MSDESTSQEGENYPQNPNRTKTSPSRLTTLLRQAHLTWLEIVIGVLVVVTSLYLGLGWNFIGRPNDTGQTVTVLAVILALGTFIYNQYSIRKATREALRMELENHAPKVDRLAARLEQGAYDVETSLDHPVYSTVIFESIAGNLGRLNTNEIQAVIDYYERAQILENRLQRLDDTSNDYTVKDLLEPNDLGPDENPEPYEIQETLYAALHALGSDRQPTFDINFDE